MNMSIKLSAVLFAVLLISSAFAGPRELTYQGQLYESGSAVDATKYFQFELIKDSVVVWKSYGTGTGRVALNVSKGFFSVPLGDTTIANMEALPAGMFDDDVAVYLKVYVGDATGDMTALSPNSKITSAAYVMNNQTQKIVLTNWAAIYGGATNVIVMTGAPLLTTPVWDDIRVPLDVANSSLYPGYKQLGTSGLYLYDFDKTKTESLNFTCQIPHTYKQGTALRPHIHWTTKYAGGGNVVWGLEYQVKWIGQQYSSTTSTTILSTNAVPAATYTHALDVLPIIPGTGLKESAILIGRVFRAGANPADTYGSDATMIEIDFHFEVEKMGTNLEIPE